MKKYNIPVLAAKVLSLTTEDGHHIAVLEEDEKVSIDEMQYVIANRLHGQNIYAICNLEGTFLYFLIQEDMDKLTKAF